MTFAALLPTTAVLYAPYDYIPVAANHCWPGDTYYRPAFVAAKLRVCVHTNAEQSSRLVPILRPANCTVIDQPLLMICDAFFLMTDLLFTL